MPEYLTPGVYLEETSFRSHAIEGVATSTFAMAGLTSYGPVPYVAALPGGAEVVMVPGPKLVTSFTEFQRAFGGLGPVGKLSDTNYLAFAARAFFGNGGRRLYVQRVFPFKVDANNAVTLADNFAATPVGQGQQPAATWRSRWPGAAANEISVEVGFRRSKNVLIGGKITGLSPGAAVELIADPKAPPKDRGSDGKPIMPTNIRIYDADGNGNVGYRKADGSGLDPVTGNGACHITLTVTVRWGSRVDVYPGLELHAKHPRSITKVLQAADPTDEFSLVWLDRPDPESDQLAFLTALIGGPTFLTGAGEGDDVSPAVIAGEVADPDDVKRAATGLAALAEVDDIAIVSSPDAIRFDDEASRKTATDDLITHCEALKAYRIGIVDPPKDSSISEVRAFRSQFDSTNAALYNPWVRIVDPTAKVDPGAPPATIDLPPSGFAAGIYSRSDIDRGVHKAPANEVVFGMTSFVLNVTYDRQSVLNPEGINALRFFEGRANRVWGARTISSDPEWKYVNVRRLFIYLEHSIDKSTQWAVFEPNNEQLWASIRQSVEDFLVTVWHTGALMGTKPEEAFFVRCDRTTMSQNDLDNGRLICLVGVAPTYPAEFVIFRIGQWTADSQQS